MQRGVSRGRDRERERDTSRLGATRESARMEERRKGSNKERETRRMQIEGRGRREEGGREAPHTQGTIMADRAASSATDVIREVRTPIADRRSPIAIRTLARSRDQRIDTRDPTRRKLLRSQTPAGTTAKLPLSSRLSATSQLALSLSRYAFSLRILSVETGKELVTRHIHTQGATKAR